MMTDRQRLKAFMKAADAFDKKVCRTKRTARNWLIKTGIITKTGRLTKNYK